MRIKYFVLISIFYMQTTMTDPSKKKFLRTYLPTKPSFYHGYRRIPPRGQTVQNGPPGGNLGGNPGIGPIENKQDKAQDGITSQVAISELPAHMTLPRDLEKKEVEETTVWMPLPAYRVNLTEQCDYIAHYCLKAYKTGEVCGRTILYGYYTFKNYCMLDYVNCMRQFDAWMLLHMGPCFNITFPSDYIPPDREGGADLAPELLKNMVLDRVAELQVGKRVTDDY